MDSKDPIKSSVDDDEEDLDMLRLAALNSLKKTTPKSTPPSDNQHTTNFSHYRQKNIYSPTHGKRGRGYNTNHMRGSRNGQFNSNTRTRNTNLISIPTQEPDKPAEHVLMRKPPLKEVNPVAKLILPQDRYAMKPVQSSAKEIKETSSKFSRYDNSDKSESESEFEESEESEEETPSKLERSDSLEALMQELENEIQGSGDQPEVKSTPTRVRKKKDKSSRNRTTDETTPPIDESINSERLLTNPESEETVTNEKPDKPIKQQEPDSLEIAIDSKPTKQDLDLLSTENISDDDLTSVKDESHSNAESDAADKTTATVGEPQRNKNSPLLATPSIKPIKQQPYRHDNLPQYKPKQQQPRSPPRWRNNYNNSNNKNYPPPQNIQGYNPAMSYMNFPPHGVPMGHMQPLLPFPVFNPPPLLQGPPPALMDMVHPNPFNHHYDQPKRALSPLALDTAALCAIAQAPLSPRSAAFVLQNREIIERRRKSPKRSYSRSPSPRFRSRSPPPNDKDPKKRRSHSPIRRNQPLRHSSPGGFRRTSPSASHRRVLSPVNRRSPLEQTRSRRKSLSPRRISSPNSHRLSQVTQHNRNLSPPQAGGKARNASPNGRKTRDGSPKRTVASVRDRLGTRAHVDKTERSERKRSRSNSATRQPEVVVGKKEEEVVETVADPILEARKKKFERSEISGGIIRLKKDESETMDSEVNEEVLLLDDDVMGTKVDDIFSDDQSEEEEGNEGRFKSTTTTTAGPRVVPLGNAVNGTVHAIKTEPLTKDHRYSTGSSSRRDRKRKHRSKTPTTLDAANPDNSSRSAKQRIAYNKPPITTADQPLPRKHEEPVKEKLRVTSPIESKKIEIKIRNPAKYETLEEKGKHEKEAMKLVELEGVSGGSRREVAVTERRGSDGGGKVEVAEESVEEEDGPEVVIDDGDEDDVTEKSKSDGGDLRAQLSRKRAQRQNKLPVIENIQSRLLQSALQDAVFKKVKKSKKSKHRESALKDGKLPIHLRLGLTSDTEIFTEHKKKKKSKHRTQDQV